MTNTKAPISEADTILFYLRDHKLIVLDKSTTDEEEKALERLKEMRMIEKNSRGHFILTPRGRYCANNEGLSSPISGFQQQYQREKLKLDRIARVKKKVKKILYDPWTIGVGSGIIIYVIFG